MRLAILADIHGNLPAFEAALKHAAQQKADQLIIAGDIVNGAPDSKGCLDLARSLGCPILRGNHEGLRHAQRLPALGDGTICAGAVERGAAIRAGAPVAGAVLCPAARPASAG